MQQLYTATMRGRTQTFTATIYQVADSPVVSDTNLQLADVPVLRYGRRNIGYGTTLLPSYTELSFIDPDGAVRDTFAAAFEESDYLVHITGDGFSWKGRVQRTGKVRPIARRVFPVGTTTLRVYDGLAGLEQILGGTTVNRSLRDVIADALFAANSEMDIWWHLDILADNASPLQNALQITPRTIRFTTEIGGDGRGDYGNRRQQLETAAAGQGLVVFQNCETATWHAVHRPSIGEAIEDEESTEYADPYDTGLIDFPADEYTLSAEEMKGEAEDVVDSEMRLGKVILRGDGQVDFVVDGCFDYWGNAGVGSEDGELRYWSASDIQQAVAIGNNSGCTFGVSFEAATAFIEQRLLEVSAEADIRVRIDYDAFGHSSGSPDADLQLQLIGVDGQSYWADAAGAWQTTEQDVPITAPSGSWSLGSFVTTADFPVAGELLLTFRGVDWNVTGVGCTFEDSAGAAITDWTFTIGDGNGQTVEVQRSDPMEVDETGTGSWAAPTEWASYRYGATYNNVGEWQAEDRLFQQQVDLDVIDTTLWGIHGPQRRLRFDSDEDGADEYFLMVGAEIRFEDETTKGVWVQLPDEVAELTPDADGPEVWNSLLAMNDGRTKIIAYDRDGDNPVDAFTFAGTPSAPGGAFHYHDDSGTLYFAGQDNAIYTTTDDATYTKLVDSLGFVWDGFVVGGGYLWAIGNGKMYQIDILGTPPVTPQEVATGLNSPGFGNIPRYDGTLNAVFYRDGNDVRKLDVSTLTESVLWSHAALNAIDVDPENERVYYVENQFGAGFEDIERRDYDGTNEVEIQSLGSTATSVVVNLQTNAGFFLHGNASILSKIYLGSGIEEQKSSSVYRNGGLQLTTETFS